MPIPTKKEGENQDEFISRCMGDLSDEYDDVSQRYAICISSYENRQTNLLKSEFGKKNDIGKLRNIGREIAIKKNLFVGEKVSIDFDDTLSTERGKELAKRLLSEGKDLHIVTRRQERTASKEVYDVAKEVGIDRNKVHFTNGQLKWKTLQRLGIVTHYDNNPDEINAIKINTKEIKAIKFSMMEFAETSWNDYPESASNNACKVLRWRDEHGDEVNGMTIVGWNRANQLCGKENISRDTIARMAAFERHRKNAEVASEFKDTPWKDAGYVAWLGWGGTTGIEWAKRKLQSIDNQKFAVGVPHYTKDGKLYEGPTHKDASGRLMTGAVHTEDSEYLYHEDELEKMLMAEIGPRGGINPTKKAPKSDTPNTDPKRGSDKNEPGAASKGRGVEVPASVERSLQKKADDWNEKYKEKRGYGASVGMLKTVYQRGVGAFQTSHSPVVKSSEQWGQARVNAFLYLLKEGRPQNPKYVGDYDLLPKGHPKSDK